MKASQKGLAFVACRETCSLTAYRDTKHLAIGFGHNDPNLQEGQTATMEEVVKLYVDASENYSRDVERAFPGLKLTQQQFDALFSLVYNIGATQLSKEKALKEAVSIFTVNPTDRILRDQAGAAFINVKYDKAQGYFNFSRRAREAVLFVSGDYGDISTLKVWEAGKSPRDNPPTPPAVIPMPDFRSFAS